MPASYSSPGVYVEEVPPMSRPIAGVSTSTPGFVAVIPDTVYLPFIKDGACKWSAHAVTVEELKPQRISSWSSYVKIFGDFVGNKDATAEATAQTITTEQRNLAHAVFGFFNNGGTGCYVVRITNISQMTAALTALSTIEEISMVAAPGLDKQEDLIGYASKYKQFAIMDFPGDATIATAKTVTASSYAAAYYPWLEVFDPGKYLIDSVAKPEISPERMGKVLVPPSGHIAGIYARSDAARGAFKAPANEALLGVTGLSENVTRDDQASLNDKGVNIIRQLNGALRVWGARTAGGSSNGEYRYVSTRRYFNYLRQSIDSGTQFVVFEPHTPALWQRVIRTLTDFLTNEWRAGALFGETAKQAFFIKCDAETNPSETREQGQLIVEIGVAIVKPAEFVIFRIQQTSGS